MRASVWLLCVCVCVRVCVFYYVMVVFLRTGGGVKAAQGGGRVHGWNKGASQCFFLLLEDFAGLSCLPLKEMLRCSLCVSS